VPPFDGTALALLVSLELTLQLPIVGLARLMIPLSLRNAQQLQVLRYA